MPARDVPVGIVASLAVCAGLYVGVVGNRKHPHQHLRCPSCFIDREYYSEWLFSLSLSLSRLARSLHWHRLQSLERHRLSSLITIQTYTYIPFFPQGTGAGGPRGVIGRGHHGPTGVRLPRHARPRLGRCRHRHRGMAWQFVTLTVCPRALAPLCPLTLPLSSCLIAASSSAAVPAHRRLPPLLSNCLSPLLSGCYDLGCGAQGVVGLATTLLIGLYAQARVYLGMARDGAAPAWLAKIHLVYKSPYNAQVPRLVEPTRSAAKQASLRRFAGRTSGCKLVWHRASAQLFESPGATSQLGGRSKPPLWSAF